jgi:hypothetical protein
VTRNPWNEAEARWVYDSNANSVEDQGANRSGDKKTRRCRFSWTSRSFVSF